ncbi:MAG: hypothetical protein U1F36_11455 [Planctomycetota bacterium]
MEFSFLFWLAYQGCALVLALWAAGSAIFHGGHHGGSHRAWTLLAALLLPACLAMAALATPLHRPEFELAGALVPVLVIAAAWSNTLTVSRTGRGVRILHAPIALWNAALVAIYLVRGLQQIGGQDCGDLGAALVCGHAMMQTHFGRSDALSLPVFLHLPLCLPLMSVLAWPHRLAIATAALASTIALVVLASVMPWAWDRVAHARQPLDEIQGLPDSLQVGLMADVGSHLDGEKTLADQRALWTGLGADLLCIDADGALFEDAARLRQVLDELAYARNQHRGVMVIARPPAHFALQPARDLDAFVEEMAKVHWLIAERLAPDWLVLYDGPFGALVAQRAEIGTIDAWEAICARGVGEVERANPRCKTLIVIETFAPHGRRLFDLLTRRGSPVAAVGLRLCGETLEPAEVDATLHGFGDWLRTGEADGKPVWLVGMGTTPEASGGELGQANFLRRVLRFAATQPRLRGVVVDGLTDGRSFRGLTTVDGRPRLAYRVLRGATLRPPAAPR